MNRSIRYLCLWLVAVVAGLFSLWKYESTPSPQQVVSEPWPEQSCIQRDGKLPTLVMFIHPRCPCTKASIEELSKLMRDCSGRLTAKVLVFVPPDAGSEWTEAGVVSAAVAIPGVEVQSDVAGAEATKFQAEYSGFTVLYDPTGKLLFSGGITPLRGHAGDNAGRSWIMDLARGRVSEMVHTPVYGCSIVDLASQAPKERPSCSK